MKEACELPLIMETTKNLYEHKLLNLMVVPDLNQDQIEHTIDEYT